MDELTRLAIAQLRLEDGRDGHEAGAGEFTDADLALSLYEQDLAELQEQPDAPSPTEAQIASDGELALQLQSGDAVLAEDEYDDQGWNEALESDQEAMQAGALPVDRHTQITGAEVPAESSTQPAARAGRRAAGNENCTVCDVSFPTDQLIRAPCGHPYCTTCLPEFFRTATNDESLFPPRCCRQEIPLDSVRQHLGGQDTTAFENKALEFRTADRTYCHAPTCSTFIRPENIVGQVGRCSTCGQRTCSMCKAAAHHGMDCPQDHGLQQVQRVAEREGWRRCERCRNMIELRDGCNHMTCVCGHEFCYICGTRWRTCRCPTYGQAQLRRRAEEVVQRPRQGGPPLPAHAPRALALQRNPLPQLQQDLRPRLAAVPGQDNRPAQQALPDHPAQRQRQHAAQAPVMAHQHALQPNEVRREANINRMMDHLRENHECDHSGRWRRFHTGINRCEICHKVKANPAVGECPRCFLQACYYCRRHRLR